jgi:nucleoid-associated protein YgaU
VRGTFSSFFAGTERPKRPSEIKEEEAKKAAEQGKVDDPNTPADESKVVADDGPQKADPKKDPAAAPVVAEPEMLAQGAKKGRLVLIGDSDFIRDDLVGGQSQQAGGPVSGPFAAPFFSQLLDWLAEDTDLVALQSKAAIDRTLKLVDTMTGTGADPRLAEQELRSKTAWLRVLNVVVPGALLIVLGLVVLSVRRAQKRSFLTSLS